MGHDSFIIHSVSEVLGRDAMDKMDPNDKAQIMQVAEKSHAADKEYIQKNLDIKAELDKKAHMEKQRQNMQFFEELIAADINDQFYLFLHNVLREELKEEKWSLDERLDRERLAVEKIIVQQSELASKPVTIPDNKPLAEQINVTLQQIDKSIQEINNHYAVKVEALKDQVNDWKVIASPKVERLAENTAQEINDVILSHFLNMPKLVGKMKFTGQDADQDASFKNDSHYTKAQNLMTGIKQTLSHVVTPVEILMQGVGEVAFEAARAVKSVAEAGQEIGQHIQKKMALGNEIKLFGLLQHFFPDKKMSERLKLINSPEFTAKMIEHNAKMNELLEPTQHLTVEYAELRHQKNAAIHQLENDKSELQALPNEDRVNEIAKQSQRVITELSTLERHDENKTPRARL